MVAAAIRSQRAAGRAQTGPVPATQPPLSAGLLCRPCLLAGRVRRAWTVTAGDVTCIRHVVEATDLDDMDQHNLFADLYEQLRRLGSPDAY